ncbi:MAG: hypothetical protein BVN33_05890 [Proteobacteria bacterium ST_bin13]|nr:MAG: hypothetical protein BVN33_05890 [Proteobacteria bacterium ST_bin13]
MILVDTNVWSEQTKRDGNAAVLAWLEAHDADLALSTLVIAEIQYGIALLASEKRRHALGQWLEGLESRYWSRTIDFDTDAARRYGSIAADPKAKAREPQVIDMQIAAQAQAYGASIATRNVKDFDWIDITLIDPWTS